MLHIRCCRVRRAVALCLAFCVVACSGPVALGGAVSAAPLGSQNATQNGMVRVYLSSLGSPTALTLTVAGSYSINGDGGYALSSGESLSVSFSSSTGAITLTRGKTALQMGTSFSLRRHSASGSNGVHIAQARRPSNPYPGDLSFQAVRQNNGQYKLYTIVHVYIEEYLYGVLPYEMGNGSHIEALKAQAVAARTYTVRMMQSRASGIYDLVDTTSDQVYNGTPSGNANCVAAVDGTKGIVLKNGASYTATYYGASNGGQTESISNAWGTGGYAYLGVKDDPFDRANPDARVQKATVYANATSGSNNASLMALLKTKAVAALKAAGHQAVASNTTLQTITAITPHTPKYAAPSKLYTKLDFALTATTQGRSGSTVTAAVVVTADIFAELEGLLGMSIQSSKNELWSVTKSGSTFTLEARRYGHGIGMSQRGAMYMGRQGYAYDQILGFYYEGSQRMQVSFTHTILSGASETITTVENPADIGEGNASGCTAIVQLTDASGKLALRAEKSLNGKVLGVVAHNAPVQVCLVEGEWALVRFGATVGYAPISALAITGDPPTSTQQSVSSISGFATVRANGYLNLRASGSTSASIISTAPSGAILTVFGTSGGWAHVQFGVTVAYASMDFLALSETYPGTVSSSGIKTITLTLENSSGSIPLYAQPSTTAAVLTQLGNGTTITVTRDDGAWSTVTYNGQTGYVVTAQLSGGGVSGNAPDNDGDGSSQTGNASSGSQTATIGTATAYLRQTPDPASPSLLLIGYGQSVVVLEKHGEWCQVRYEGMIGYMLTSALLMQGGGSAGAGEGLLAVVTTLRGGLNLRATGSAGSGILAIIPKGAQVVVTSRGGQWSAVRYGNVAGYVMTSYLLFVGESQGAEVPEGASSAVVTTVSGPLNLRAQPRTGSGIITRIPQYTTLAVHQYGPEWCSVTYQGVSGYVMTVFLTFGQAGSALPTPNPEEAGEPGGGSGVEGEALYGVVTTGGGALNLRQQPSLSSGVLASIPRGYTLSVVRDGEAWAKTTYAGRQGYVMTAYLTFVEPKETQQASGQWTAIVTTPAGHLNLRATASMEAEVIRAIPQYAPLTVIERGSDWCKVTYEGVSGYVVTRFLSITENAAASTDALTTSTPEMTASPEATSTFIPEASASVQETAQVQTSGGGLNLRMEESGDSGIITVIPQNETVTVLSRGDTWCKVRYGEYSGYAMTAFLQLGQQEAGPTQHPATEAPAPTEGQEAISATPTPPPLVLDGSMQAVGEPTFARVVPPEGEGAVNLWWECQEVGAPKGVLPGGERLQVLAQGDTWCQVLYQAQAGYCLTQYIAIGEP